MLKSKTKLITIFCFIFIVLLMFINNDFAFNDDNKTEEWNVVITSDAKELKDTKEINFKVEENKNVAEGKIAPGCKATATIIVNLEDTKVPVDISLKVDDSFIFNQFKLTTQIDEELYDLNASKFMHLDKNTSFNSENGRVVLKVNLEWIEDCKNDDIDTFIGSSLDTIKVPIAIEIKQHI